MYKEANHSLEEFKMYLQLFAAKPSDDEEDIDDEAIDDVKENEDDESGEDETTDEPEEEQEEEYDEIIYNKKPIKVPKSERKTLLQKGMNYDKVNKEKEELLKAIKATGFNTVDEFNRALLRQRANEEAYRYQVDPNALYAQKLQEYQSQQLGVRLSLIEQREAIKDHPTYNATFYKEHKAEIEGLAEELGGDLQTAYKEILFNNLPQYLERTKSRIAKEVVRGQKRGVSSSDAEPGRKASLGLTKEEEAHARKMVEKGLFESIEEYAQYSTTAQKRRK